MYKGQTITKLADNGLKRRSGIKKAEIIFALFASFTNYSYMLINIVNRLDRNTSIKHFDQQ